MSDQKTADDIQPAAAPTTEELRRWAALPKAEQRARLSAAIEAGFASPPTTRTIDEIIAEGQRRAGTADRD